jgi:NAD(P)-dependent dehydrogenase (short-subunit alcohol dehydrogenase family)
MPTLLVFGAANLGRVLARDLAGRGWRTAGVARSQATIDTFAAEVPGGLGIVADAVRGEDVERAFAETRERLGGIDLVVSAITHTPRGGSITELGADAIEPYFDTLLPAIWNILRVGCRELKADGGGTFVQLTGGSARRGMPKRAPWASTAFATRAWAQSAAAELRGEGVHVALLIVDAVIDSPKTAELTAGWPPERTASMEAVADAVRYLAEQPPRAWTHELQLTPALETWVP